MVTHGPTKCSARNPRTKSRTARNSSWISRQRECGPSSSCRSDDPPASSCLAFVAGGADVGRGSRRRRYGNSSVVRHVDPSRSNSFAIVKAAGPARPEFEAIGHDAVAGPERRTRNGLAVVLPLELGDTVPRARRVMTAAGSAATPTRRSGSRAAAWRSSASASASEARARRTLRCAPGARAAASTRRATPPGCDVNRDAFGLSRFVKNTKPRASKYWMRTMRAGGRPAVLTVDRQTALGSTPGPKAASSYQSRYFSIGSITPPSHSVLLLALDQSLVGQLVELGREIFAGRSRLGPPCRCRESCRRRRCRTSSVARSPVAPRTPYALPRSSPDPTGSESRPRVRSRTSCWFPRRRRSP